MIKLKSHVMNYLCLKICMVCILTFFQNLAVSAQSTAKWIWDAKGDRPKTPLYFSKTVELDKAPQTARIIFTCDNKSEVFVNGKSVDKSSEWNTAISKDIKKLLKSGSNVIAAVARNEGGPAGFVLQLEVTLDDGKKLIVVTDDSWKFVSKNPQQLPDESADWMTKGLAIGKKPVVVGKMGDGPWGNVFGGGSGTRRRSGITNNTLRNTEGFKVEMIYDVPRSQGSWVSLAVDDKGRIYASDQGRAGLYRITLPKDGEDISVEKMAVKATSGQGMVWAFDSLYFCANGGPGSGLYRLRDTTGDDQFDKMDKLRALPGGGEHGPHDLELSPDGKQLYVVAGNMTRLPSPEGSLVPRVWQEDQLLPRMPDARGHARGTMAPGGWICRTDPEGKAWELVSAGFRNTYGIAFNQDGELFGFDSDMEWDAGTPWYRPTRICHAMNGSEFGWRNGSGKFPSYYEDTLPAVVDIGPGSPTGVISGAGSKFPAKYQSAIYALDWTYGSIWAIHLQPKGSSYVASREEFIGGKPLPVTDAVIHPHDGAMYFAVGGRGSKSFLYKVTYEGKESTATVTGKNMLGSKERSLRHEIEALQRPGDKRDLSIIWKALGQEDRFIRNAARISLEHQPVKTWAEKALAEKDSQTLLTAITALSRQGFTGQRDAILDALGRLNWKELSEAQKLHMLRNYGLTMARLGKPDPKVVSSIVAKLDPHYPAGSDALNRELCLVLTYLEAPSVPAKTIPMLTQNRNEQDDYLDTELLVRSGYGKAFLATIDSRPEKQQIHYAYCLRVATAGWTPALRKKFFSWFNNAKRFRGGNSFGGFINNIRNDALKKVPEQERAALQSLSEELTSTITSDLPRPKGPGRIWTVEAVTKLAKDKGLNDRDIKNGHVMFRAGLCANCHRFGNEGGLGGPDLTGVGGRFTTRDLADAIINPNKVISDQYHNSVVFKIDGTEQFGRILGDENGQLLVMPTPMAPEHVLRIPKKEVRATKPSKLSAMMPGLINSMNADEVLDLLAFLRSGIK
ncbi:MAG: heme-binding protein [Opitutae bacterium]|nr:heme-binding protein [Opitutae bacterium]